MHSTVLADQSDPDFIDGLYRLIPLEMTSEKNKSCGVIKPNAFSVKEFDQYDIRYTSVLGQRADPVQRIFAKTLAEFEYSAPFKIPPGLSGSPVLCPTSLSSQEIVAITTKYGRYTKSSYFTDFSVALNLIWKLKAETSASASGAVRRAYVNETRWIYREGELLRNFGNTRLLKDSFKNTSLAKSCSSREDCADTEETVFTTRSAGTATSGDSAGPTKGDGGTLHGARNGEMLPGMLWQGQRVLGFFIKPISADAADLKIAVYADPVLIPFFEQYAGRLQIEPILATTSMVELLRYRLWFRDSYLRSRNESERPLRRFVDLSSEGPILEAAIYGPEIIAHYRASFADLKASLPNYQFSFQGRQFKADLRPLLFVDLSSLLALKNSTFFSGMTYRYQAESEILKDHSAAKLSLEVIYDSLKRSYAVDLGVLMAFAEDLSMELIPLRNFRAEGKSE